MLTNVLSTTAGIGTGLAKGSYGAIPSLWTGAFNFLGTLALDVGKTAATAAIAKAIAPKADSGGQSQAYVAGSNQPVSLPNQQLNPLTQQNVLPQTDYMPMAAGAVIGGLILYLVMK